MPCPSNVDPDHLRAEVKGAWWVSVQMTDGAAMASAMAARLAFGLGSVAVSWARISVTSAGAGPDGIPEPSKPRTSDRRIPDSVRVPVLSAQTTSTRARPSMAGNSWTRHWRCPSRMTPTAKAIDVMSTRPSGTIGTSAATMPVRPSRHGCPRPNNWVQIVSRPTGTSNHETTRRIRLIPSRNSDPTRVNLAASSTIRAAYASRPTFVAR